METQNQNTGNQSSNINWDEKFKEHQIRHRRGKIVGGIILFIIGAAFLAREMGVIFPMWLFTWQMLLIVIGLFVGVKNSFRNMSWFILMAIGGAFMIEDFVPDLHIRVYFWPILIMLIGLAMIFKPRRSYHHDYYRQKWERKWKGSRHGNRFSACGNDESSSSDDTINMDGVFSGFKKNIISKDFKGGTVSNVFSGGSLNLSQADINGTVVLELKQVFSGIKIIVPSNWEIQTDIDTMFGGIEDKRPHQTIVTNPDKVLVIKGSTVFGGIEIQNY
ncbi:MAG: LiaI-LiaF-like domain-containing protein [Bacteroidia bacterium]